MYDDLSADLSALSALSADRQATGRRQAGFTDFHK